jgi:hypothetical protein
MPISRFTLAIVTIVTIVTATSVSSAAAQDAPAATPAAQRHPIAVSYETYKKRMAAYVDSMPDDAFTARLSPATKSYDEIVGHTIETNFGVCAGARKEASPKKGEKFEGVVTNKAALSALLQASHAYCDPLFAQLTVGTMASSDLTFLPIHTAQMTALMESVLTSRGHGLKNSEAGRR